MYQSGIIDPGMTSRLEAIASKLLVGWRPLLLVAMASTLLVTASTLTSEAFDLNMLEFAARRAMANAGRVRVSWLCTRRMLTCTAFAVVVPGCGSFQKAKAPLVNHGPNPNVSKHLTSPQEKQGGLKEEQLFPP